VYDKKVKSVAEAVAKAAAEDKEITDRITLEAILAARKFFVIMGLAGTGKSKKALELLREKFFVIVTKTKALRNKYIKQGLCAITLAKLLGYMHDGVYYQLPKNAPEYLKVFCTEYLGLTDPIVPFIMPSKKTTLDQWHEISKDGKWTNDNITGEFSSYFVGDFPIRVSDWCVFNEKGKWVNLTKCFTQHKLFRRRFNLGASKSGNTDFNFLLDDVGLFSETDSKILIELIEAGFFRGDIAVTFDPMQLSYGGKLLVKYLKSRRNSQRIYCDHEWRFDNQKYTWRNFTVEMLFNGTIPVIYNAVNKESCKNSKYLSELYNNKFKRSMAVGHSLRARNRAISVYGFDENKTINVDKCQGREYDFVWLDLAGLAACGRSHIPNWQERLYTTITRGKSFGFYVLPETSENQIREYCSWLLKMRDWVINNSRLPTWFTSKAKSDKEKKMKEFIESLCLKYDSILKLKKLISNKLFMYSFGKDGRKRDAALKYSCRLRFARCSGGTVSTMLPEGKHGVRNVNVNKNKKTALAATAFIKRPLRFWPVKPKQTARVRLFNRRYV
jgi:hypothetical protein